MLLCELVESADPKLEISGIFTDSRKIRKNGIFVCLEGTKDDGHNHIAEAEKRGAALIVASHPVISAVPVLYTDRPAETLAGLSERFYQYPAEKLRLIGVTGTNGKTTVTYLIKAILEAAEKKCGLIGTNEILIGEKKSDFKSVMPTTPDALELSHIFSEMVSAGMEYAVMEVSSHALELGRVAHLCFEVGIFTNLTRDHLDFHHTMERYRQAKEKLFSQSKKAVINIDDPVGAEILTRCPCPAISVGCGQAELCAKNIVLSPIGTNFVLTEQDRCTPISLSLCGRFNVLNALCAIGAARLLELPDAAIVSGLSSVQGICGRLEHVPTGKDFQVLIDYAHSPDSLENILKTLAALKRGRLVTLFGCGGDRDRTKRAEMGRIAETLSDFVIVTSDNPRTENPLKIIEEIRAGMTKSNSITIPDRRNAIWYALENAQPSDLILLAGKGQETYQIIGETKYPLDEREIVKNWLKKH